MSLFELFAVLIYGAIGCGIFYGASDEDRHVLGFPFWAILWPFLLAFCIAAAITQGPEHDPKKKNPAEAE